MVSLEDDRRLDNIFKEIMSDEVFCNLFPVEKGVYKNIAQGLKSENSLIVALATMLREINRTITHHEVTGGKNRIKDGVAFLNPDEKKSIYRKIVFLITG